MITNKASLLTLCLIASSAIAQQNEQRTFMQRAKQKKDQLITHVKENKKAYTALGFSVTALIVLIVADYKYNFLDKLVTSLRDLLPDNANPDVSDDKNNEADNTNGDDLNIVEELKESDTKEDEEESVEVATESQKKTKKEKPSSNKELSWWEKRKEKKRKQDEKTMMKEIPCLKDSE